MTWVIAGPHQPAPVLELAGSPDRWLFCVRCQKPWPCPDAPAGAWVPEVPA